MIELIGNSLHVTFPEVHRDAECEVTFYRTLRVPDDGTDYPLPAGLGAFPLCSVDDCAVPSRWKERGGVIMPMYQSEAMWVNFTASSPFPFALKIAAGKINAVTGAPWANELSTPQDYMVLPEQRWIDGFYVAKGIVRQFVAAPLGEGLTVEEQISGKAEFGGLQLLFMPMRKKHYLEFIDTPVRIAREARELASAVSRAFADLEPLIERAEERMAAARAFLDMRSTTLVQARRSRFLEKALAAVEETRSRLAEAEKLRDLWQAEFAPFRRGERHWFDRSEQLNVLGMPSLGLGAGGKIRQEIAGDPWGIDSWDREHASRCFVHLLNSEQFEQATGKRPLTKPFTQEQYKDAGVPWFDYYLQGESIEGSEDLHGVKSVSELVLERDDPEPSDKPIHITGTVDLSKQAV